MFICFRLASSLEGRQDDLIHVHLDRRLEKASLEDFKVNLEISIREVRRRAKHQGRLPTHEEVLSFLFIY
jgi:hypothetical protein